MTALSVSALAVEIRDLIAKPIGLGNTASLATLFAKNPHHPSR